MTPPSELFGGPRRRRVIAGEYMVTPVKPLELGESGRGEELLPGRDRLAPDHWAVRKRPEWFKPCDPKDTVTFKRHRETLQRTQRHIERQLGRRGTTRATTRPRQEFSLGDQRPRERWRLS